MFTRTLSHSRCLLLLAALLMSMPVVAQFNWAIPDEHLVEPWSRTRTVILLLTDTLPATLDAGQRTELESRLNSLETQLAGLQAHEEEIAIRIVTVPEFSYIASETSGELSNQVLDIEKGLDWLSATLKQADRTDVRAAQESLKTFRQLLHEQNHFERDVIRAIGSGSRNEMQTLAGRWWKGAESVGSVKDAVAAMRSRLQTAPGDQPR